MRQIVIKENEAGQRIDKFLHKYLKEAPNSFLFKMMRKKNIVLNGKKTDGRDLLKVGDEINLFLGDDTIEKFRGNVAQLQVEVSEYEKAFKTIGTLPIIFENEHVLLVNKPSGILTQKATPTDASLNEWLIGYLLHENKLSSADLQTFKPSICNRLDRNTSGLVICGKSLTGSQRMSALLKDRTMHKFYRLYVKGTIAKKQELNGYLLKDESNNKVKIIKELTQNHDASLYAPIVTRYEPIAWNEFYTYVEVELVTGKTHQIRAHLSSIGHPLAGDGKYGDKGWNQTLRKKGIVNQMLHAYRLEFPEMEAPLDDMSNCTFIAPEPSEFWELKLD